MTALLLVLGLCLAVSFLISAWQGALQSIPTSRVETLRQQPGRSAAALSRLLDRYEETMIALLALDMASNAGVVVCSVKIATRAADALALGDNWGVKLGVAAVFLFGLFLFFDLLPRTLGVSLGQGFALRSARAIHAVVRALAPVVVVGRAVAGLVKRRKESGAPTAEDLLALATSGARAGNLEAREARWVKNALSLGDVTVRQIMTPRTVVYALPAELPLSMVKHHSEHWAHSRLPIFRENNPDDVVGLILRRTVFDKLLSGETQGTLEKLALPIQSVPDSMTLDHLLEWFVSKRQHLAVVRDEFQVWVGIVTLEDVLETFLGAEIVDEKDKVVDMRELATKRLAERGQRLTASMVLKAPDAAGVKAGEKRE
jgi:CBS domain containing-hemolysin-like protein